ncbi:hypothetical protein CBR_g31898 [Chara braunii]|uniref:Uncharacterized protein n=1 Tax=Chara braunii TaxID=69332 RepID=A0A388LFY6_CHABU|nr:hypothetical protein CBR_g31898 [Chara braunii]|eukprot:GBG81226.1 hypothetical protein CBR_g31898 [Chara braunii]
MEQNRNPSLSASALSSRMESATADRRCAAIDLGRWSMARGAQRRSTGPFSARWSPPFAHFQGTSTVGRPKCVLTARSDTYTSMLQQRAEESFSSLMGQAASAQPQSAFPSAFPSSMGWGMPHEQPDVPRMQWSMSFNDSITGGRVDTGVTGEDGRAAMQTSNLDVNVRGPAETQRGAIGGGSAPRTAPSPDGMDFSPQAMEDGDSRRPPPMQERRTCGVDLWRTLPGRRQQRPVVDRQCRGWRLQVRGRQEKANAEMLAGTFVTALEGLNKTMADDNSALLQCFTMLTGSLAGGGRGPDRGEESQPHEQRELQDEVDCLHARVLMLEPGGGGSQGPGGARGRTLLTSMDSPSSLSGGTVASAVVSFCQQGAESAVCSHGQRRVAGAAVHGRPCLNPGRSLDTNRREIDWIAERVCRTVGGDADSSTGGMAGGKWEMASS